MLWTPRLRHPLMYPVASRRRRGLPALSRGFFLEERSRRGEGHGSFCRGSQGPSAPFSGHRPLHSLLARGPGLGASDAPVPGPDVCSPWASRPGPGSSTGSTGSSCTGASRTGRASTSTSSTGTSTTCIGSTTSGRGTATTSTARSRTRSPFTAPLALLGLLLPVWSLSALLAGILQAYIVEEWVHHSVHFYEFRWKYFRYIKRHHLYHHSPKGMNVAYGLTQRLLGRRVRHPHLRRCSRRPLPGRAREGSRRLARAAALGP